MNGQVIAWYVCVTVTTVFLSLRLIVRWQKQFRWKVDDGLLILAYCCLLSDLSIQQYMYNLGMDDLDNATQEDTIKILSMVLPGSILYITSLWSVKAAMVVFYKRLAARTTMHTVYNLTLVSLLATYLVIVIDSIFQCWPVQRKWTLDPAEECSDKQISINYWLTVLINITTDVIMMSLPISMILRLRIPFNQRVGIAAVFALGFLVVIASSVRAYYSYSEQTMLTCTVSMIEQSVAIIATCLPILRTLLISHNTRTSNDTAHHELSSYRINATLRNNNFINTGSQHHSNQHITRPSDSEIDLVTVSTPITPDRMSHGISYSEESKDNGVRTSLIMLDYHHATDDNDDGQIAGQDEAEKAIRTMNSMDQIMVSTEIVVSKEYGTLDQADYGTRCDVEGGAAGVRRNRSLMNR